MRKIKGIQFMILELLVFFIVGMTILTAVGIFIYSLIPSNIPLIDWATLILACATIYLAYSTRRLWEETKEMRLEQSRPVISFDIEPVESEPQYIIMSISNCGNGLAKKIWIESDSDFDVALDKDETTEFYKLGIIKRHFELGRGSSLKFVLTYLPRKYEDNRKSGKLKICLSIKYEDISGKEYGPEDRIIDLEIFHQLRFYLQKIQNKKNRYNNTGNIIALVSESQSDPLAPATCTTSEDTKSD